MENIEMGKDAAGIIKITYFVAECMEFKRYGAYMEEIFSIEEALKIYDSIPPDRLHAGKGIGIHIYDSDVPDYVQEFQLLTGNLLDIDTLQLMYGFEKYPQLIDAAKTLITLKPGLEIMDCKGLLEKQKVLKVDAGELAGRINKLQRKLDPDSYDTFYPDASVHEKKIAMQILTETGRKDYLEWVKWLAMEKFSQQQDWKKEVDNIHEFLADGEIRWPKGLTPFVLIEFSEDAGLEDGDVLSIEEADPLFGKLDQMQVMAKKEHGEMGYNKTCFQILYPCEGECSVYKGRQDFGDGDGTLLEHIEGFQKYYLDTEEGKNYLELMDKEHSEQLRKDCEYIRDDFLPFLKYYCNLHAMEKALKEEQEINQNVPLVTDQQEARKEYQKDMLQFICDSRHALSQGKSLPKMPDIRDYEETKEKKAYREHVMREIEDEAKGFGMTAEEYAKNGYEPIVKKR